MERHIYRDRAAAKLKSYFAQAGYYGDKTTVKLITFSGKEETYHAWDGIPKDPLVEVPAPRCICMSFREDAKSGVLTQKMEWLSASLPDVILV